MVVELDATTCCLLVPPERESFDGFIMYQNVPKSTISYLFGGASSTRDRAKSPRGTVRFMVEVSLGYFIFQRNILALLSIQLLLAVLNPSALVGDNSLRMKV